MTNFRLLLEYEGSGFEGWQAQGSGHRTVQAALERALSEICGQRVNVIGAGRTDAGVHAEGQVASVRVETALDGEGLRRALNGVLPEDVAVLAAEAVAERFHARRDARSKHYRYRIWNGRQRSPLRAARSAWVAVPLDVTAMAQAGRALLGRHDFASFQGTGSSPRTTERTLFALRVTGASGSDLRIDVEGDGFLRHMVRNLVGTLIEVGRGRRTASSVEAVLAARDRRRAGPTAPARGLTLVRVDYATAPGPTSPGEGL